MARLPQELRVQCLRSGCLVLLVRRPQGWIHADLPCTINRRGARSNIRLLDAQVDIQNALPTFGDLSPRLGFKTPLAQLAFLFFFLFLHTNIRLSH